MRTLRVAVCFAIAAAAVASGCGDGFEPAGTGGAGGDDGGAGASGSAAGGTSGSSGASGSGANGGSGGAQACSDDTDCDDDKVCNGKETCSGGKCQAGTPVVCNNPDPATCTATCQEPTGDCLVTGNDADGDQHKANCPADPGDDCDDTNTNTYLGAVESCDGNDNNCNGMDDLQDGHPLSGTSKKLVGVIGKDLYDPEIAWCPGGSKFVMVWTDTRDGSPRTYAASVSPNGVVGLQKNISWAAAGNAVEPNIACHGSECMIVWRQTLSPIDVFFQRVDCDASFLGDTINVSNTQSAANFSPSVARLGDDWIVSFIEKETTGQPAAYRVVAADGTPKTSNQAVSELSGLRYQMVSAATSTHVGFFWELAGNVVEWSRIDGALNASTPQALSPKPPPSGQSSRDAHATAHLGNFAIAWSTVTSTSSAKIEYVERASDGNPVCANASLANYAENHVIGIASHKDGALVAALTGGAPIFDVSLLRVKGCNKLDEHDLTTSGQTLGSGTSGRWGSIAGGDGGYAVVWATGGTSNREIHGRLFGPNLCN